MKFRWDKKYLYWGMTAFLVIAACICFFLILYKFPSVANFFRGINKILFPFVLGLIFAYLLNPVVNFFETKCFKNIGQKAKSNKFKKAPRALAILVSVIILLLLITGLIFLIIPQLIDSVRKIINDFPSYYTNFKAWSLSLVKDNSDFSSKLNTLYDNIGENISGWASTNVLPQMTGIITKVTTSLIGIVTTIFDIFIGLVVSVYVLFSKEKFCGQAKKIIFAIFPTKTANISLRIVRNADETFGGFLKGKLIDSLIIGLLCFIGLTVLRMPYALLISIVVGIFNIIPFFGPIIGAIPGGLIILMINPLQCLYFVIFIIILQQFDGNILGPKILGNTTGITAIWIVFSILLFGGLFGFVGMVIGVPLFSIIYSIVKELVNAKLKSRGLPTDTKVYADLKGFNNTDFKPKYDDNPEPDDDSDMKIFR